MQNSTGPNTEPLGTPKSSSHNSLSTPLIDTHCVLPVNLFYQLILLMMAYCKHNVRSLREMLSACLTPLSNLNFSLPSR